MSQAVVPQSSTLAAELSVCRSLSDTAKALKETRMDGPFPPSLLSRLKKSLDFCFRRCDAQRNRERQGRLQQELEFSGLIVCCMSFSLISIINEEFDYMITSADNFVRARDLARRLYHPEIHNQLKKLKCNIEHQVSCQQFYQDYYRHDYYLYMSGVPSYVPQPGLRSFNIASQIEDDGYIEFHTPQARLLTAADLKDTLRLQEFTPGQITLLFPAQAEDRTFILIGLTTTCTNALNDRLSKPSRGSGSQSYEYLLELQGTWDLTKRDVETMPWSERDTGPYFFVPATDIHRPSYIAVTITWDVAWAFMNKYSQDLRQIVNHRERELILNGG